VLHGSKYKTKIDSWCSRAKIYGPKMCGLSYFAIQIQSWFFKTQCKSNHSPTIFLNVKSKSKWSTENWKNAAFSQQKYRISFPLTYSKPCLDPKFWSALHSGSNPNSTKFAVVRIQSNPSPVQCSSLLRTHTCTPQSLENLIVTKVSLRKINNYQDHNRLQMEKSKISQWLFRIRILLDWRWTDTVHSPRCVFAVRSCPMKQWFQVNWKDTSLPITLTL